MYQGVDRRDRQAGWWIGAQGVALLVLTGWLAVDLLTGRAEDVGRGLGVVVIALCGAVAAGALAWALSVGKRLARTPTMLWHGLLVLVGISVTGSGEPVTGVVLIVVGVIGCVLALRVPAAER